jgi:hypothetical protein
MNRGVNASIWLWATESGEQHAGSEQELVACLTSRALPPYTLVWRSGWSEWLPAMQVAELSRGLPEGSVCAPRSARSTSPGVPPPPPPLASYPELKRWAEELQQSSGPITRRAGVPVWAQTAVLNESPSAADPDAITEPIPAELIERARRLMMAPAPPADLGIAQGMAPSRASSPALGYAVAEELLEGACEPAPPLLDASSFAPGALDGDVSVGALRGRSRGWLWVFPVAALAAAGWFGRGYLPFKLPATPGEPEVAVLPVRPAAPPSPEPAAPKVFGCRVLERPQKLDDWALPDGPLVAALAPDGKRVALGYAQSRERAIGISFDPTRFPAAAAGSEPRGSKKDSAPVSGVNADAPGELSPTLASASPDPASIGLTRDFQQYRDEPIYSVTPLVAGGKLEFRVEREGEKLTLGTAIDGVPPLRIGANESGFVGGLLGRRPHRIWWLPRPSLSAVPAYTRHPFGYLIAARVGRKDQTIRVGVISPEATAHTPFSTLELPKGAVGLPALASKGAVLALAVVVEAERAGADRLLLARGTPTELPLVAAPLPVFGTSTVELANPALAPLGGEGFALSWSEGVAEQRRVRLLLLDDELAPRGEPFDVALPRLEHGGAINGALFWANERLLALYYLRRPDGYSLWVDQVTCGEY